MYSLPQVDDVRVEVILQSQHAPSYTGRLTILTGADLMPSPDNGEEPPEDDEVYAAGGGADQDDDIIIGKCLCILPHLKNVAICYAPRCLYMIV